MSTGHMSMTLVSILLTASAVIFYGAFVLYEAWIDGRRQKIRNTGRYPVTEPTGEVHAREEEQQNGSNRP